MLLCCLLVAAIQTQAEEPLQAGRDAPPPKRIHYVEPQYPDIAREAGVAGVVLVEIGVKEDGHPHVVLVIEAQPLLDKAALDAVRQWRYEPTVVDGRPRRVRLRELVEVFPDRDSATRYFANVVQNRQQPSAMRAVAAQRLLAGGDSGDRVQRALEQAAKDTDPQVSRAAADALRGLQEKAAGTAR
jgi:TonB family protein